MTDGIGKLLKGRGVRTSHRCLSWSDHILMQFARNVSTKSIASAEGGMVSRLTYGCLLLTFPVKFSCWRLRHGTQMVYFFRTVNPQHAIMPYGASSVTICSSVQFSRSLYTSTRFVVFRVESVSYTHLIVYNKTDKILKYMKFNNVNDKNKQQKLGLDTRFMWL